VIVSHTGTAPIGGMSGHCRYHAAPNIHAVGR
jgi:hypothetical protein